MSATFFPQIINPRLLAVLLLGFASGLPLALTGSTLQAWMTEANVSLAAIGALSLVGIPYTLKFLWAPLLDYLRIPFLGLRRGWIMLTQICLILALIGLAGVDPLIQPGVVYALALTIAFFSASQDVAIDAYRADILKTEERGLGAAYSVFAYRMAMLFSGGLALVMAAYIGWRTTYLLMALVLSIALIGTYFAPLVTEKKVVGQGMMKAMTQGLWNLLQREKIVLLLIFLLFYKIGDALALQLMTNFLLHGLGFTLTEVGLAYKFVSFFASISGAFVGGLILTRLPIFNGLFIFGILQAFSNLMFVVLALYGKHFVLMASAIFIENFCSGLSTAALIAFMMSLCDHRFTATQFALLSAITSLGRVFLGPLAAFMVQQLGWAEFYSWTVVLSFPGLLLLLLLKDEVASYAVLATD